MPYLSSPAQVEALSYSSFAQAGSNCDKYGNAGAAVGLGDGEKVGLGDGEDDGITVGEGRDENLH
jgi:hypothetical protein